MLKLINIQNLDNTIEADYIPESGEEIAHASIDKETGDSFAEVIEEYGSMYSSMARQGLRRLLRELKNGEIKELPKERLVMWF